MPTFTEALSACGGLAMPDSVRSRRTQEWFFVQNTIIDDYGEQLGPYGIAIYATLCRFANNERQDCFPNHATLAHRIGTSKRQVVRKLRQLLALKLISWDRQQMPTGGNTSNLYVLLDPPPIGDSDSQSLGVVTGSHRDSDSQSPKLDSIELDSPSKGLANHVAQPQQAQAALGLEVEVDPILEMLDEWLRLFSAKRWANAGQHDAVVELAQTYPEHFLDVSKWCAERGMGRGQAIAAMRKALPKWGTPRPPSKGNSKNRPLQDEPAGYAGIRDFLETEAVHEPA